MTNSNNSDNSSNSGIIGSNSEEKLVSAEISNSTIVINKEEKEKEEVKVSNNSNENDNGIKSEIIDLRVIKSASITLTETISPKRKPYTVYRVEVELSDSSVYVIYRRYSEFLEFDLKLHAAFPLAKIPFPPKKTFGKMNNEFIGQRKEDLQKFTNSIFNSPTLGSQLSTHPLVVDFFTANDFDTQHSNEQNNINNNNSHDHNNNSTNNNSSTSSSNNNNNSVTLNGSNKTILFNNRKNRAVSVSHGSDSSVVVTRLIISTLSYWAHFLDLTSLLSLTNTCNYLFNTISNFADLWKVLYYEHFTLLHFNQLNITNCQCQFTNNKKDNSNSNNNSNSNSNNTATTTTTVTGGTLNRSTSLISLSSKDENCIENNSNISNNNNNSNLNNSNNNLNSPQKLKTHRLTSSSSSLATLSSLFSSSQQNLLDNSCSNNNINNNNKLPIENKDNSNKSSIESKLNSNNSNKLYIHGIYKNFNNINHNQVFYLNSKPIIEFNRTLFLHLLSTHFKLRTHIDSHTTNKHCSCYALKFRGTIIGTPLTPDSFLSSFNTLIANSKDNSSKSNDNSNSSNNYKKTIISHTTSNNNIICIQTVDTSKLSNTERLYNLSFSHFTIITFSLIDKESFEDVSNKWFDEVKSICPEVPIILVGLHRDQREKQSQGQAISYVQGLELSRSLPDCIGYIESPSASDGVGGNRNSLLNELSSLLFHYYRDNVFTFDFKKNKYEVYLSFLTKIYPKYSNDYITNVLSSYSGDIEKTMETLTECYSSYTPESKDDQKLIGKTRGIHIRRSSVQNSTSVSSQIGSPSPTSSSPTQWVPSSSFGKSELRQSWNAELSKMDKEYRDRLIEGYISDQPKQRKSIVLQGIVNDSNISNSESTTPLSTSSTSTLTNSSVSTNSSSNSTNTSTILSTSSSNSTNTTTTTAAVNTSPVQVRASIKIPDQQVTALVDKLKKSSVDDFIKGFLKKKSQNQDILAEMILSFLREMKTKIQSSQVFSPLSKLDINEEDFTESPLAEIENYLYQSVYKFVFSSSETLERDSLLTERTNKLSTFLEPQHLEISPIHCDKDLWATAQQELQGLNDLCSPSQKLECILKCCKVILFLLSSSDSPGGADDFLPHLIYVIIHANVPHLVSNFEFISKFCNPEQLRMERYYYLTTFGIAITFIENIDAKQLKIDPDDYQAYMTGKKKVNDPSSSKAKIMQKLGIDEKTASLIEFSPSKKHSRRSSATSVVSISSSVSSSNNQNINGSTGADDGGSNHNNHNNNSSTNNDGDNLSSSVGSYSVGSLGSHHDHFDDLLKQVLSNDSQPVPIQSWSTSPSSTPFDDLDDGNKKLLLRFSKSDNRHGTSPDSNNNLNNTHTNHSNNNHNHNSNNNNNNNSDNHNNIHLIESPNNVDEHPLI